MAEVEIHTGHDHSGDSFGQRVGVAVGVIGIALAIVTIGSHRAHNASVIEQTQANDQWGFYQAKKIREHLLDVGASLATTLGADSPKARELAANFTRDRDRYKQDAEGIERDARAREEASKREEQRAVRLDLGEGFLELGLVLSSLYFLSKRRFFPIFGGIAAVIGTACGIAGWLL